MDSEECYSQSNEADHWASTVTVNKRCFFFPPNFLLVQSSLSSRITIVDEYYLLSLEWSRISEKSVQGFQ